MISPGNGGGAGVVWGSITDRSLNEYQSQVLMVEGFK